MASRHITGFHVDDAGDWVAELDCGHTQHVRHRPPWQRRRWVTTQQGRDSMIGAELDCLFCDMPALPDGVEVYKQTPVFDQRSIPSGLRRDHRLKPGTWGRIVVLEGRLSYEIAEPEPLAWVLAPGISGIIAPETAHRVEPVGAVRFRVEFLRRH